jgi:hypothetical protein
MVKCADCGAILNEPDNTPIDERIPCPACGSKSRAFEELDLPLDIGWYPLVIGKVWNKSKSKKPLRKFKSGDDFTHNTGKWSDLKRTIDHEKDEYEELITDKETGEVIHHCKESLSQHKGHGSAKTKKTK